MSHDINKRYFFIQVTYILKFSVNEQKKKRVQLRCMRSLHVAFILSFVTPPRVLNTNMQYTGWHLGVAALIAFGLQSLYMLGLTNNRIIKIRSYTESICNKNFESANQQQQQNWKWQRKIALWGWQTNAKGVTPNNGIDWGMRHAELISTTIDYCKHFSRLSAFDSV